MMPAGRARKLFLKLVKTLGPALGELTEGASEDRLSAAIQALSENLSEVELDAIFDLVFNSQTVFLVDGSRKQALKLDICELHFRGKFFDQLKVLAFAIEVNFSDFLDVFKSPGGLAAAVTK